MGFLEKVFGNYSQKEIKRLQPTVNKVLALENEFAAMLLPPVGKPAGVCWK